MQTAYYNTTNFIRHTENIIDLSEYRRRLERAEEPSAQLCWAREKACAAPRARRGTDRNCRGLFLDLCASAAIVVMTAVVVVQFLI